MHDFILAPILCNESTRYGSVCRLSRAATAPTSSSLDLSQLMQTSSAAGAWRGEGAAAWVVAFVSGKWTISQAQGRICTLATASRAAAVAAICTAPGSMPSGISSSKRHL